MISNNMRNRDLECTPTFGTQTEWPESLIFKKVIM